MINLQSYELLILRELPTFCKHREALRYHNGNIYGLWQMLKTSCAYPRGCPRYLSCCQRFLKMKKNDRVDIGATHTGWSNYSKGPYIDAWEIDHIPTSHHRRV